MAIWKMILDRKNRYGLNNECVNPQWTHGIGYIYTHLKHTLQGYLIFKIMNLCHLSKRHKGIANLIQAWNTFVVNLSLYLIHILYYTCLNHFLWIMCERKIFLLMLYFSQIVVVVIKNWMPGKINRTINGLVYIGAEGVSTQYH